MDEAFEEMWDSAAASDRPSERRAIVRGKPWNQGDTLARAVNRYLPDNYRVDSTVEPPTGPNGVAAVLVVGHDQGGWTLDGYVLPRLATGMYFGVEVF